MMDITPQLATLDDIDNLLTRIRGVAVKDERARQLIGGTLNCLVAVLGDSEPAQVQFVLMLMRFNLGRMETIVAQTNRNN